MKNLEIKCPTCGKVTKHYLSSKKGEYRCLICGTVNKKVSPKKKDLEVVFEADEEFNNQLNLTVEKEEIAESFTD